MSSAIAIQQLRLCEGEELLRCGTGCQCNCGGTIVQPVDPIVLPVDPIVLPIDPIVQPVDPIAQPFAIARLSPIKSFPCICPINVCAQCPCLATAK